MGKWLGNRCVCILILLGTLFLAALTAVEYVTLELEEEVPVLAVFVGQENNWLKEYQREELALDDSAQNELLEQPKPGEDGTPPEAAEVVEITETEAIEPTEVVETSETVDAAEMRETEAAETPEATETSEAIETPDVTAAFPYYIKINRMQNCITVYTPDENGEYTIPYKAMVCSTGLYNATPSGTYQISTKYRWRELYGGVYGQYATRIHGAILFHSVPYYTKSNDNLCTDKYNKLGQQASMGCVRLTTEDAKWIADNCPSGTSVEIYDDEDPGPLGKPEAVKIDADDVNRGWDPTDPDENNPWLE
uniref:L,D-transpeptidase family protein n=1 Tax=Roseburia sp. TaxID=2049040 RepID=UPI003FEDDC17